MKICVLCKMPQGHFANIGPKSPSFNCKHEYRETDLLERISEIEQQAMLDSSVIARTDVPWLVERLRRAVELLQGSQDDAVCESEAWRDRVSVFLAGDE